MPVTSTDLYPTFLDAAGLPPNPTQHVDGVSLVPLLDGGTTLDRDAIFWHYPHYANQGGRPAGSVRAGDWKLIEHYESGRIELFDLRADESEKRDLAKAHPHIARRLHERLTRWQQEVEALIPKPNPNYQPPPLPDDVDPAQI